MICTLHDIRCLVSLPVGVRNVSGAGIITRTKWTCSSHTGLDVKRLGRKPSFFGQIRLIYIDDDGEDFYRGVAGQLSCVQTPLRLLPPSSGAELVKQSDCPTKLSGVER